MYGDRQTEVHIGQAEPVKYSSHKSVSCLHSTFEHPKVAKVSEFSFFLFIYEQVLWFVLDFGVNQGITSHLDNRTVKDHLRDIGGGEL